MLLLLAGSLVLGCGDSSESTRDAAPDTVTIADTGAKPDLAGDTGVTVPDSKPAQPDAGTDQIPSNPDTTPAKPDGGTDTPAPTGDGGPVIKDAPVDRAADLAGDAGSTTEAGSSDTGTTD